MKNRGWWAYSQAARGCVQCLVLACLCLLPWAHSVGWAGVSGSFFALDVYGLPFADPLSLGQTLLQGSISAPTLWWGAGVTLLIAVLLGRVFCGWICPYGLASELVWRLRRGRGRQSTVEHLNIENVQRLYTTRRCGAPQRGVDFRENGVFPENVTLQRTVFQRLPALVQTQHRGGWVLGGMASRVLVLLVAAGASVFWALPVLLMLSMPGALSLLPTKLWYGGAAVAGLYALLALPLLALLLELLTGRRLWCLWLCPQSVLLSGAAALGAALCARLWTVRWQAKACTCAKGARPCATVCSMGLQVRKDSGPARSECLQCGACVAACRTKGQGALSQGMRG